MANASPEQIVAWAERQKSDTPTHEPKYKRLTHDQQLAILRLHKLGKTQPEIAQVIGCHQTSVCRWLQACDDSTAEATAFLRGQALPMAQSIVKYGKAADKVNVLKGINVIEQTAATGLTIQIGGAGEVKIGVLMAPQPQLEQREG